MTKTGETTQVRASATPEAGSLFRSIPRAALAALQSALAELPQNSHAWTYTIRGFDNAPYLTRTLLPRIGGHRLMLHRIHREDQDRHCHNHPWATARFLILSGGYVEERVVEPGYPLLERSFVPGDINSLTHDTFHRISYVAPDTWTLGLIGVRVQDWGFLVDGAVVPHAEYFARKGYEAAQGASQS